MPTSRSRWLAIDLREHFRRLRSEPPTFSPSTQALVIHTLLRGAGQGGRQIVEGLAVIGVAHLITLKARAWLDLTRREQSGEKIDSKAIKKHKNDVFRLFQILDPTVDPAAPDTVKRDPMTFITRMASEDLDLKALGFRSGTRDDFLTQLAQIYRLD